VGQGDDRGVGVDGKRVQGLVRPFGDQCDSGKRSGVASWVRGSMTVTAKPIVVASGARTCAIWTAPTISSR
jgi:hypothetical protein